MSLSNDVPSADIGVFDYFKVAMSPPWELFDTGKKIGEIALGFIDFNVCNVSFIYVLNDFHYGEVTA